MKAKNLVVVGLGGQGVVSLSHLISKTAIEMEKEVAMVSQKGLAQRGGEVICHIRYGEAVNTPLVPPRRADYEISMEAGETLKYSNFLNDESIVLANEHKIDVIDLSEEDSEEKEYPTLESIENEIKKICNFKYLPAQANAKKVEMPVAANIFMMGGFMEIQNDLNIEVAKRVIQKEFAGLGEDKIQKNLELFKKGRKMTIGFEP